MRRLARRLLCYAAMMSACGALGVFASGCVVPTPLSEAPPAVPIRPAIDAAHCTPQFGPFPSQGGARYVFDIAAEDGDPDVHQLYMRMFRGHRITSGVMSGQIQLEVVVTLMETLTASDPMQPQKYSGAFTSVNLCDPGWFADGDLVYLVVSDTVFNSNPTNPIPTTALTDQNYWVLSCP